MKKRPVKFFRNGAFIAGAIVVLVGYQNCTQRINSAMVNSQSTGPSLTPTASASPAPSASPSPTPGVQISQFTLVDGGGNKGIVFDPNVAINQSGSYLATFNSKLYAGWDDSTLFRVAVYNGNDAAPAWSLVDGGGLGGGENAIGLSPVYLISFNGKLYGFAFGEIGVSCAYVYNGNDAAPVWTPVGGSSTSALPALSSIFQPVVFNGKLYVSDTNAVTSNGSTAAVFVYNGNDAAPAWKVVNGTFMFPSGIGFLPNLNLSVFDSKLYATWNSSTASNPSQIRVAVYNGNDAAPAWSYVDGGGASGINKNSADAGLLPQAIAFNSKLYDVWFENGFERMAVYNGDDAAPTWSFVDNGGIASTPSNEFGNNNNLATLNGYLYVNFTSKKLNRVSSYNGDDGAPAWSFVDNGGISDGGSILSNQSNNFVVFNSKLYTIWSENNQIHVAVGQP